MVETNRQSSRISHAYAAIENFRMAIATSGLEAPDTIQADGEIHRFSSSGRRGDDSGWYVLYADGIPAGSFGDWRADLKQDWCARSHNTMTVAEREVHQQRIKAMRVLREAEQARRHESAAEVAVQRLHAAISCNQHGYLSIKGVKGYGVKVDADDFLIVPMRDTAGKLHSLQTITLNGDKRFLSGGRVKGCYHAIGKPNGKLIVCEGYATGATIHEATGDAVAVAFNAGNLGAVAYALHKKYPELAIVIAADDDHKTDGNPGLTSAKSAALTVGGFVVAPQFPADRPAKATDFNDMAAIGGLDAVRCCFAEHWEFAC